MRSSSEVLEGNKVKLSVEVDEEELEDALTETVKRLQREVRVPGFRPGKVPRRLLEVRLGPKVIREEVIRHSLPEYYAQAVEDAALDTIAAPEIDITSGEEDGPLAFSAVVEVRPKVSVAGYEGLQVTVPSPVASEEEVDRRIDRLRDQFAQLNDVDREAREGDVVTIDVSATRDGEPVEDLSTTDFVYELGSAMVAPGVDEKLAGAKAGDIVEVEAPDAPGGPAMLKVLVKGVREKVLPEADDDWASEASEFDTLEELRADVRQQLGTVHRLQATYALREGVVAELSKLVDEEIPETLVAEELERLQSNFVSRLSERKITLEQYLEATGQEVDGLVAELRGQAVEQVRADLALRALAEAEGIEVSDEEVAAEITAYAESIGRPVATVARQFAETAGLERLRSEIRNSKAVTWLVEHVEVLDEQGNPMDRALLLEQEGAPAEAGAAEPTDEAGPAQEAIAGATVERGEPDETEEEQA
ncbi:MAG TPA: trigger factor [Acidimicrobiales bacterium]|nr:trigger factor [Acidimicrobiales bacterium]